MRALLVALLLAGCNTPRDPVVGWIDQHLIPLGAADDLAPLGSLLGGRAVVAMGETTHGTKEFFELKGRVFRWLVEHDSFQTLAMEMEPGPAAAVDAYLQTGQGDLDALVRGTYFFFEAREIVALLAWMRHHNETAATKVHLVGIDLTDAQKATVATKCGERAGCKVVMRDGLMADNVLARGAGTFVWAHNGHVAHFAAQDGWKPMGQLLREALGERYYAIAFEFDEGGFVAPAGGALPVLRTRTLPRRVVAEYVLQPAPPDALAHVFAQARRDVYFVELTALTPPVAALFADNRNLQSYGALDPPAARRYESYAPLDACFDAVVFVRRTHGYTWPAD